MRRYLLVLLVIAVLVASFGAIERQRVVERPPPLDVTGRYTFGEGAARCEVDFKRAEPLPILADGGSDADQPIGVAVFRRVDDGRARPFAKLQERRLIDVARVVWDDGTSCTTWLRPGDWQPIDCPAPALRRQHGEGLVDGVEAWGLLFGIGADLRRVVAARGPTWEETRLEPLAGGGGWRGATSRAFSIDGAGLALLEQDRAPVDGRLLREPRSHRVITLLQRVDDCPAFVRAMRDSVDGMVMNGDLTQGARDVLLGASDEPLWLTADWKIPPDHRVRAVFHVVGHGLSVLTRYSDGRADLDEVSLWRFDAPADPTDGDLVLRARLPR